MSNTRTQHKNINFKFEKNESSFCKRPPLPSIKQVSCQLLQSSLGNDSLIANSLFRCEMPQQTMTHYNNAKVVNQLKKL